MTKHGTAELNDYLLIEGAWDRHSISSRGHKIRENEPYFLLFNDLRPDAGYVERFERFFLDRLSVCR